MADRTNVNRRQVLCGSVAALLFETLPGMPALAQVVAPKVTSYSHQDPAFQTLLTTHFAALSGTPSFQTLLPHAHIYRNDSGEHLHALSIDWVIPRKDGGTHQVTSHYLAHSKKKLDLRPGFNRTGRALSGRRVIIKQGDYFLATPMFVCSSFSLAMLMKHGTPDSMVGALLTRRKTLRRMLAHAPEGAQAAGTLRSIVVAKGGIHTAAADHADVKLQRRYFSRRTAEQHEAASVLALLQQGQKRTELRSAVEAHIARPIPKAKPGHPRVYAKSRQRYARHILHFINTHPLKVTQKMLESVVAIPAIEPQVRSTTL